MTIINRVLSWMERRSIRSVLRRAADDLKNDPVEKKKDRMFFFSCWVCPNIEGCLDWPDWVVCDECPHVDECMESLDEECSERPKFEDCKFARCPLEKAS